MFYKKDDINEDLQCAICHLKFQDPRILPCGQTYCQKCIQELMKNNVSVNFRCPSCDMIHHEPIPGGFPPNKVAAKLVNKASFEISRGGTAANLKHVLQVIDTDISNLNEKQTK